MVHAVASEPNQELGAWDSIVEPGETYMVLGNSVGHLLYNRDYTVILGRAADSYAMPNAVEQWQVAQAAIYKLLGVCDALDSDGITLYTPQVDEATAHAVPHFQCHDAVTSQTAAAVLDAHQPPEQINLALSLQTALADYFRRKAEGKTKPNGEVILVLFDGEPQNRMGIVRTIVDATKHVDGTGELGIGLLQIGESPIAEGFFGMLDHDLKLAGAAHDIVKSRKIEALDENSLTEFLTQVLTD